MTISPEIPLTKAKALMTEHRISGLPVVVGGKAVGILTNRDLRFERNLHRPVHEVMSEALITVAPDTGLERAKDLLQEHKSSGCRPLRRRSQRRRPDGATGHRAEAPCAHGHGRPSRHPVPRGCRPRAAWSWWCRAWRSRRVGAHHPHATSSKDA